MAVEAIQAVTELEERVKKQKEAAAVQNKQRLLEAQRAARLLVEQSRQQAEGVLDQAKQECEALKTQARGRLSEAAAFLVEKVVN